MFMRWLCPSWKINIKLLTIFSKLMNTWFQGLESSDPVCLAKQCAVLSHSVLPTLCDPINCSPPASSVYGDSPGKNTGVSCHVLLCRGQLDKQGFWKRDMAREWETRHKNSEKSEDQGTNTASKVKVLKVNPSQLYYTFSHNWKNMRGVKL